MCILHDKTPDEQRLAFATYQVGKSEAKRVNLYIENCDQLTAVGSIPGCVRVRFIQCPNLEHIDAMPDACSFHLLLCPRLTDVAIQPKMNYLRVEDSNRAAIGLASPEVLNWLSLRGVPLLAELPATFTRLAVVVLNEQPLLTRIPAVYTHTLVRVSLDNCDLIERVEGFSILRRFNADDCANLKAISLGEHGHPANRIVVQNCRMLTSADGPHFERSGRGCPWLLMDPLTRIDRLAKLVRLQKWVPRALRLLRFNRFRLQRRYSGYLDEPGQFGHRWQTRVIKQFAGDLPNKKQRRSE